MRISTSHSGDEGSEIHFAAGHFSNPAAHAQTMEMMQQALWPGVFVSSSIERSFKVNLDCTPKIINQASSDAAVQLIITNSLLKGWRKTNVQTVVGGQGTVFTDPKTKQQLAIGSDSMYALMICTSNKPLK